jgi:tetratricopeptide (TPR) repeat protein
MPLQFQNLRLSEVVMGFVKRILADRDRLLSHLGHAKLVTSDWKVRSGRLHLEAEYGEEIFSLRTGILRARAVLCATLSSASQRTFQHHDIVLRGHVQTTDGRTVPAGVMITLATRDGIPSDAFYQLARLYMTERRPADSEAILRQALRLSPGAWLLHYHLATAQFALGEYREAAKSLLTAQSLHPDMPADFHAKLAETYLKMAEYAKALAEIDTYLRLSAEGPYAARAKRVSTILRSRGVTADAAPQTRTPSTAKP